MKAQIVLLAGLLAGKMGLAAPRPTLTVPRATLAPRVDADSTDPAWKGAALIPSLSLSLRSDAQGKVPTPTQVRLLWDENFFYIRFECRDDEIYAPYPGGEAGHDAKHFEGDVAELFLDPVGDAQQYFEIQISPKNGIFDAVFLLTAKAESDSEGVLKREVIERNSWNFEAWNLEGLRSAAMPWKNGHGWTADLALPAMPVLKRLGLKIWKPLTMKANFVRYDQLLQDGKRNMVSTNWSPFPWGRPHRSPQAMGTLILLP